MTAFLAQANSLVHLAYPVTMNTSDLDDRLRETIAQAPPRFNVPRVRKVGGNQHIYLKANGDVHASFEYFIGLGPTRSFYTLWRVNLMPKAFVKPEQYIQNLSEGCADNPLLQYSSPLSVDHLSSRGSLA
jgi:hypothetical protein